MIMSGSAPPTRAKVPAWEYLFIGLLVAASIGYSVACVISLAAVGSIRSIAAQVLAGQHPDGIIIQIRLTAVSHATDIAAGLGWLALVVFFVWSVIMRRRFRASGQTLRLVRSWAYRAWLLAVVVSVLLAAGVAGGFDSVRTVADVHRAATFDVTFFAIRGAVGLIYIWCAAAMFAARRHLEAAPPPATVAGADLSYEDYVAMRAAQRAASSALAPAPAPPIEATTPIPPVGATAPTPPNASAGEMTSEAPSV